MLKQTKKEHRSIRGLSGTDKKKVQSLWLPEGITCTDCRHFGKCNGIFGTVASDVDCQFYPNRFIAKKERKS